MTATLSEMASIVWRYRDREAMIGEEMDAYFAPSECATLAYEGASRDLARAFRAAGWDWHDYNRELDARTSARFAHFSGLSVDEDALDEARGQDHWNASYA